MSDKDKLSFEDYYALQSLGSFSPLAQLDPTWRCKLGLVQKGRHALSKNLTVFNKDRLPNAWENKYNVGDIRNALCA
jgi:hypothetical protein